MVGGRTRAPRAGLGVHLYEYAPWDSNPETADLTIDAIDVIKTHNPFAVNDLWFAQQMGIDAEAMNPYGCSLVYGHPQAPTGTRGIAELIEALRLRGGGTGLFTGCAAGDTSAAVVIRVN